MSKLVIVESPAKAKTIGKYLGSDYVVKASMGHLRDLPKKKMSIDIEHDFQPEYVPIFTRKPGRNKAVEIAAVMPRKKYPATKKRRMYYARTKPNLWPIGSAVKWG